MNRKDFAGLTPNQVVAQNLFLARTLRGWTQEQAAEKLEPHLGVRWSKASYSAAERSVVGERIRQFTADDLYAFSKTFDLPLIYFLLPPPPDVHGRLPAIHGPGHPEGEGDSPAELLEQLFRLDEPTFDRLAALFQEIPPELHTEIQSTLANRTGKYVGAIIGSTLGDLATWQANLRDLAGVLELVQQQAVDQAFDEPDVFAPAGAPFETATEASPEAVARLAYRHTARELEEAESSTDDLAATEVES